MINKEKPVECIGHKQKINSETWSERRNRKRQRAEATTNPCTFTENQ